MDGAWALYEAWVKLQLGEVDTALVYGYGKSSPGPMPRGADPPARPVLRGAAVARRDQPGRPAGPRAASTPARSPRRDSPRSPSRSRRNAHGQPVRPARVGPRRRRAARRAVPRRRPLRKHDCPPITDGAAAVILAAGDVARELLRAAGVDPRHRPPHRAAWPSALRDLTDSRVDRASPAEKAGVADGAGRRRRAARAVHLQELILRDALGLGDDVDVNPSGGALAANPMMAAGLIRIGEAAQRIIDGDGRPGVAHATSRAVPATEPRLRPGG